ncbi:MAG: hypothetical protein KDD56_07245, partial [Bdellovibrionales bacterium]|nr:hypothetical protein [Bdellovibrionales bacterium]
TFLKKNNNTTLESILDSVPDWMSLFKQSQVPMHGLMISTAFGCNYEGKIETEVALRIIKNFYNKCIDAGGTISEISLADTMGWGTPDSVKRLIDAVRQECPSAEISLHLHDTRGSGMANVYAGLEEGIEIFDTSIAGMGGCPFARGAAGNVPTEDVVYLCESMGVTTGINLEACVEAAKFAEDIIGSPLPGKYYKTINL